jgi:hypothetical protein
MNDLIEIYKHLRMDGMKPEEAIIKTFQLLAGESD